MTARTRSLSTVIGRCPAARSCRSASGSDGVSIVAASWARALSDFGFDVVTVAGDGPVDRIVPGLAIDAPSRRPAGDVEAALADADLVVVENLCTIPLNLPARRRGRARTAGRPGDPAPPRPAVAATAVRARHRAAARRSGVAPRDDQPAHRARAGRAGHHRHHDLQRLRPDPPPGDRDATREALDVGDDERLSCTRCGPSPARTSRPRCGWPRRLGATYWLLGPAEDGYDDELDACSTAPVPGDPPTEPRRHATPTPPPTPSRSRRRGRASATHRSRPPSTAGPSRSATTPSPTSCGRSASSGSTPTTPQRSTRSSASPTTLLDRNRRGSPSSTSRSIGWRRPARAAR